MHGKRAALARLIVVAVVIALAGVGTWYYLGQQAAQADEPLTASGTIEADEVTLSPAAPGSVTEVLVDEGASVATGQPVVVLDGSILEAQRDQAVAQVTAAEANVAGLEATAAAGESAANAAEAGAALLEAGPSVEELAVAQATVDRAQVAVDDLEEAYDDLSEAEQESPQGTELLLRRDLARAELESALANQRLIAAGPSAQQIEAARAEAAAARAQADAAARQVEAARAQVEAARAALAAIETQIGQLTITSPVDGVVLTRAIEPGEYAAPGAALVVVGRLDSLSLTVYVPEDRYGQLSLGQTAQVAVDSFPGETFSATVAHIADEAEFTPRNVQTAEGRRSTVFAIRLSVQNPDGRLKPGMPADVRF